MLNLFFLARSNWRSFHRRCSGSFFLFFFAALRSVHHPALPKLDKSVRFDAISMNMKRSAAPPPDFQFVCCCCCWCFFSFRFVSSLVFFLRRMGFVLFFLFFFGVALSAIRQSRYRRAERDFLECSDLNGFSRTHSTRK